MQLCDSMQLFYFGELLYYALAIQLLVLFYNLRWKFKMLPYQLTAYFNNQYIQFDSLLLSKDLVYISQIRFAGAVVYFI